MEFFYNGDGTLIKRTNSLGDVWDYVGNMIFKNGIPYQMNISEGRVVYVAGVWVYLGEQARPNHRGDPYQTKGVFSRTPFNGIIPKFKPRKR